MVENPLPGAGPGDDPCVKNPSACTETPRETHFENSELGKLLNFTWKGLSFSFGEISGQNNKKRREAQALKRRYAEIEALQDQATAVINDMNEATDSVLAVAGDLSKSDRYNLTGESFGQTKNAVAAHNRRAAALDQDTGDIPEKVVTPPGKVIYDTPDLKSVEQARQYRNYVSRQVEAGPESFKPIGRQLIGVADSALDYSEAAYRAGDKEKGDFAKEMAITSLDLALSLTPGVGLMKDIYEAASGKSLLTGKIMRYEFKDEVIEKVIFEDDKDFVFVATQVQFIQAIEIRRCKIKAFDSFGMYSFGGLMIVDSEFDCEMNWQCGGHNKEPILIENCRFNQLADFEDCYFMDEFILKNVEFVKGTNLLGNKGTPMEVAFDKLPQFESVQGDLSIDTFNLKPSSES